MLGTFGKHWLEIELSISGASITREEDESISQGIRLNVWPQSSGWTYGPVSLY